MKFTETLLKYRKVDDKTGCWNWTGSKNQNGYGQLNDRGEVFRVHRVAAFVWMNFDIDSNILVLHKCDNKICFNPEHLYFGNKTDNMNDFINRVGVKNQNVDKQYCIHGHEFTPENTRIEIKSSTGRNRRYCKRCEFRKSLMRTHTGRRWLKDNF